jgi:NADPH:quinone reductase-like Zn-dependent oxidoreductase
MPENQAAWLNASKAYPLEVRSAPYTSPAANEIVIKNRAVAINPIDWMLQQNGTTLMFNWLKYPFILGSDVAGEVVEIGSDVKRFKVGDRVASTTLGTDPNRNRPADGAFQTYPILVEHMTTPIPESMSFEQASVLGIGFSTAATALFQNDLLNLQLPTPKTEPKHKTVLIWGGSTSVGLNAIQLAVAAGYDVITTTSPKNFALVKELGAGQAFDYNSPTVVNDIIAALKGKTVAGAISMGSRSAESCMSILAKSHGNKFIAMATYPMPEKPPTHFPVLQTALSFISWNTTWFFRGLLGGVKSKFIFGTSLAFNDIGKAMWEDFLPTALAEGRFVPKPDVLKVEGGLEMVQEALEIQKKGVSAKKVVLSLL